MATYKEIHGVKVQYRDSDATAVEGDVWYNSSTGLLKMYASLGSWASGGNRNNAFHDGTGVGIQTAALAAFGAPGVQNNAEEYNGSSWTEVTAAPDQLATGGGGGIQTSAVFAGGYFPPLATESFEYDGTNWTEGGDINTGRKGVGGSGSASTAALIFGGEPPGPGGLAITEQYDGTSWTEVGDLQTSRYNIAGCGTTTATLASTGAEPHTGDKGEAVEVWNGTAWTEVNDTNTARHQVAKNAAGTTTDALIAGGKDAPPGATGATEVYDGSSWTEVADLSTVRQSGFGGGTGSLALVSGGTPPETNATEEWSFAATIETVAFD
jgi:hypothetical protein